MDTENTRLELLSEAYTLLKQSNISQDLVLHIHDDLHYMYSNTKSVHYLGAATGFGTHYVMQRDKIVHICNLDYHRGIEHFIQWLKQSIGNDLIAIRMTQNEPNSL